MRYQAESLEAFVAEALEKRPTGVILTGDMTLNGEKSKCRISCRVIGTITRSFDHGTEFARQS